MLAQYRKPTAFIPGKSLDVSQSLNASPTRQAPSPSCLTLSLVSLRQDIFFGSAGPSQTVGFARTF